MKLKPLSKVGKDDPKGWEGPPDHYPITLEPQDDNELPVPYYDSDEEASDNGHTTCDESDSDYMSDASSCSSRKLRVYTRIIRPPPIFKTVVAEELDFVEE